MDARINIGGIDRVLVNRTAERGRKAPRDDERVRAQMSEETRRSLQPSKRKGR